MPGEEERKRGRKRMSKIEIFMFGFSTLLRVSATFRVDLALEWLWDIVCKLFNLLCFVFWKLPPIPCVQVAILKLPHSQLRIITIVLDYEQIE